MSGAGASTRILLVEDNETIRNAFAILLEESGYAVLQAGSGEEAMRIARESAPDLILMDLGLPDMHGLEVTRAILSEPATARIPIVALTGRALETDQKACLDAGCVGFLAKPVDSAHLLATIPQYLEG